MAFDIKIVVEAVDKASAVLQAIRTAVGGLNTVTNQVAGSAGGVGGAIDNTQNVLQNFAASVAAIPNTLAPMAEVLAENASQFAGLSAGVEGGTQTLSELDKVASAGAPAVSQVAEAVAKIEQAGQKGAATTKVTADNIAGLAESIQDTDIQARPAASALDVIHDALSRLAETTDKVVATQALFAQSTARLAPLLAQNAQSIRQANEETSRSLSTRAAGAAKQTEFAYTAFEGVLKRVGLTLKDVEQKTDQNASSFARVRDVIRQNTVVFGGLAAAIASVPASLALLTRGAVGLADNLNDVASATGTSVEFLSSMDLAARQNGTNLNELVIGFRTLSRAMVEGQDPASEAARTFRILGIDIRALSQEQRNLEVFLPILADGFTRLEDGAGKLAIAQQLLGRSGEQLIPLFNQGSAGLAAVRERARELGGELSGATAKAADEFNDKLAELGVIFRAIGLQVAEVVLPALRAFVEFALAHPVAIKAGFLGIAAAVTAVGVAIAGVKVAGLIDALLTAIAGPAALAKVTSMSGVIAALKGGILNLLAPLGAVGTATSGAFGLAVVSRIGLAGAAVAALVAVVWTGVEAWKAYRARQAEALATRNLEEQNVDLRGRTELLVQQFREEGRITEQEAAAFQERLQNAFTPAAVRSPIVGRGGVIGFKTEIQRDPAAENAAIVEINKVLRSRVTETQTLNVATDEGLRIAKTELEIAQSNLATLKSTAALELQTLQAQQERPGSTVTAAEAARRRLEINERIRRADLELIRQREELEINEARRSIAKDVRFTGLKEQTVREQAIENETAQAISAIRAKATADRTQVVVEAAQRQIEIQTSLTQSELEVEQRNTALRLEEAQSRYDELRASELQFQLDLLDISEQVRNLSSGEQLQRREELTQRAIVERQRRDALIFENQARRRLELQNAIIQSEIALAQTDPNPNVAARQQRVNDLLREQNELIRQEIELNRQRLAGDLSPEERIERQRRVIELQSQLVANDRAVNIQDPTNLPRLQGDLGFQNQLTADGQLTGERELITPFRALDEFLSGTLQTTFNGLSQSITGLITGASTWAQVWTQAGNQIIGMIVQLILEYTVFHQIRSALDSIFHQGARANIAGTAAAGKAAQTGAAATAAATSASVATAAAPAAAATSIWSFGSSATIGLALALAAIAAIVAALAFARGGVVPERRSPILAYARGGVTPGGIFTGPGGPTEDRILTTAPPGTGILTAQTVSHYGGPAFVANLLARRAPVPLPFHHLPSQAASREVAIRVSPGEAAIPPDVVRHYGGPGFIDALNARRVPLGVLNRAAAAVATIPKFAGGGIVDVVQQSLANVIGPGFDLDLGHFQVQEFANGGSVAIDNSNTQAGRVNAALLQAQVESNPTVNVASPEVILLKRDRDILEVLRSTEGRAIILDTMSGARTEFGVRS